MKIGLIGCGNMGTALVQSFLEKEIVIQSQVLVYDKLKEKSNQLKNKLLVEVSNSVSELLSTVN